MIKFGEQTCYRADNTILSERTNRKVTQTLTAVFGMKIRGQNINLIAASSSL
jgi:hypothetical protein